MLSYNDLLEKAKNNAELKKIHKDVAELKKNVFGNLSEVERDSLSIYHTEIEDLVFKNFAVKLSDFKVYPEDFLNDLFA